MPRIYRHEGPKSVVDIPNLDLLTLLFDSEHTAGLPATLLHIDATNPENVLTKFGMQTLAQRIAHGIRTNYSIGATSASKDVVTVISNGQILVPAVFYGVLAAGGVYSAASPHSTVSELARTVNIGTSKLIICGTEFVDVASKAAKDCGLPLSRVLVLDSTAGSWSLKSLEGNINAISNDQLPWRRMTDPKELKDSLIVILWSSGTTGLPKGVMLSHLNLVAECYITSLSGREWAMKQIEAGKTLPPYRTLAHLPISHIAGLFGYLIAPLYSNGTVFWMRKYSWQPMIENVKKFQITALYTVPSIFLRISKAKEVTDHFSTVEAAVTGAAPMDGELQVKASSRLGSKTGEEATAIGQTWGLSETTGAVTAMPRNEKDDTGCIGRILPNVELR
jgi:4-coumarate--CoA ligase